MKNIYYLIKLMLFGIARDSVLRVILAAGSLFLCAVPFLSLFSLRQVQQLMVSLSLSWISLILLLLAITLGSTGIWRDIERRWLSAIVALPLKRSEYAVARIFAVSLCLVLCSFFLGCLGTILTLLVGADSSTAQNFSYFTYWIAILLTLCKYLLVVAIATCFSAVATSFFFSMFASLIILFSGSASQGVIDYISSPDAQGITQIVKMTAKALYYILPNFSLYDLTAQAVYGLAIEPRHISLALLYFLFYFAILVVLSIWVLNRRELR